MWKDVSSRSRGDKDMTPNAWEFRTADLHVYIHRNINYGPDVWLLSITGAVSMGPFSLSAKDDGLAKHEALWEAKRRLLALADQVNLLKEQ